jgi:hypothetical protein
MNPFLLSFEERLRVWKELRKSLPLEEESIQFTKIAEFWSKAPLVTIAYDPSDATNWPTPWEMIRNNEWCRSSIAIGMENTLRLSGFSADRLKLQLIIDREIQEMLLVLNIDDKWILNYDWGHIKPCQKHHVILKTWQYIGKSFSLLD